MERSKVQYKRERDKEMLGTLVYSPYQRDEHCKRHEERKNKENSLMFNKRSRSDRNTHTKNKYTPVQRTRK